MISNVVKSANVARVGAFAWPGRRDSLKGPAPKHATQPEANDHSKVPQELHGYVVVTGRVLNCSGREIVAEMAAAAMTGAEELEDSSWGSILSVAIPAVIQSSK